MELRAWIQENIKIIKLVMAWLVFVATLSLSVYLGDYEYLDKDPAVVVALFVAIRVIIIAALSIFYVYGMIPFIGQTNKDKATRQFWAAGVGFFVLILFCPLAAIMSGMGLGVGVLYWLREYISWLELKISKPSQAFNLTEDNKPFSYTSLSSKVHAKDHCVLSVVPQK